MKAIRVHAFGGPAVLALESVEDPVAKAGEVLVRIGAAGVNPVETYVRSGAYAAKPPLPWTPGQDGAGTVVALGEGARRHAVGERVYIDGSRTGTYAELAACPEDRVYRLPERASFAQGAALGIPYATAYRALFQRGAARPGEVVLIHGATGGVGLAAVQWSRAAGLTVIATGGTEEGRRIVAAEGAHHVLDHRAAGYEAEVVKITDGRGVDLVLEVLANVNLERDLGLLARGGRVLVVGSRGRIEIDPRATMMRDASILGLMLANISMADRASVHAAIVAGLEAGTLRPVIATELPLADASRAHELVLEPGARGKIVLVP